MEDGCRNTFRNTFHCVCLLLQDLLQSCSRGGGGGEWRTCAMIDDEPMVENPGVGRLMTRDGPM